MRAIALIALAIAPLLAQIKPAPKPFTPPDLRVYAMDTILIKDEGCARDYLKALQMEGVELRKALGDLENFGCAQALKGVYGGTIWDMKTLTQGTLSLRFDRVTLVDETFGIPSPGPTVPKQGWLLDRDVLTRAAIEKLIGLKTKK